MNGEFRAVITAHSRSPSSYHRRVHSPPDLMQEGRRRQKMPYKNGGLNWGFSWLKSKSETFQYGCTVVQGDVARVWSRNQMGWSDTAQPYCRYAGCVQPFTCGTWSFGHVDWARNKEHSRQTSSSFGDMVGLVEIENRESMRRWYSMD